MAEAVRVNQGDGVKARLLHWARAGRCVVTHKTYRSDFRQGRHEHPTASIDYVLAGGGRGIYGGSEVVSGPGAVEYFPAEQMHTFETGARGIRSMHIVLPAELVCDSDLRWPCEMGHCDPAEMLSRATSVLVNLTCPDASSSLEIESHIFEMLSNLQSPLRPDRGGAKWLDWTREMLHEHADEPLELDALAQGAGVHKAHLVRTFTARYGASPGEYHRRVRVGIAAKLLASTRKTIATIAVETGFADQAHLTRVFRSRVGITPARYRRTLSS